MRHRIRNLRRWLARKLAPEYQVPSFMRIYKEEFMFDHCKKQVTKEWYETYKRQGKTLTPEQKHILFGDAVMCGYGLYGYHMTNENGEYFCYYKTGTSCD